MSAAIEPFHDTAQFEISGAAAHAKLAELVQESLVLVGKLRDEPVTDRELRKAKRRYCLDLASAFDDPDAMAGWFGGTELFYPPSEFDQKVARMEAVTADDVQRVAQAMFRTERLVVAAAGGLTARQRKGVERVIRAWK